MGKSPVAQQPQQARAVAPVQEFAKYLELARYKFAEVAPKHLKVDRLIRLMLSAISRNPKILECSKESVLQFCMKCSETGLEPIGAGGAWAIPFKNNKTGKTELTFIPDYRGLVNAAKHAGCIEDAWSEVVYEHDEYDCELGMSMTLSHKPARGDRGQLESAYCIMVLPGGSKRFVRMSRQEIESIRNRGQAWKAFLDYQKECPWNTDEGEMWKKTVTRRAMKPFAGASSTLDSAIRAMDESDGIKFAPEPIAMPKEIPAEVVSKTAATAPPQAPQPGTEQPGATWTDADLMAAEKILRPLANKAGWVVNEKTDALIEFLQMHGPFDAAKALRMDESEFAERLGKELKQ